MEQFKSTKKTFIMSIIYAVISFAYLIGFCGIYWFISELSEKPVLGKEYIISSYTLFIIWTFIVSIVFGFVLIYVTFNFFIRLNKKTKNDIENRFPSNMNKYWQFVYKYFYLKPNVSSYSYTNNHNKNKRKLAVGSLITLFTIFNVCCYIAILVLRLVLVLKYSPENDYSTYSIFFIWFVLVAIAAYISNKAFVYFLLKWNDLTVNDYKNSIVRFIIWIFGSTFPFSILQLQLRYAKSKQQITEKFEYE
ncbi:hypothetical protein [Mycoplasmopsis verecunda]|uniref:Uncharacterized protein n=1 Tax=Mycoplasmopsis verecunda TaxID=171291 RepID=A0A1T4LFK9_9BACT|nr:hypothetical protein [Mycoplasmopsis verecunda]WPB54849.1 hypothetical protein SAM46_01690 [Mycoplasmopsis verecunda]SJZ53572.1 hypothetical protein SAMN02745154_00438 [Mycoplasmopsis verecunda]